MTWEIILEVILLGIALSMDAFAVAIADGLTYQDLNKKRIAFIAFMFGFFQAAMPLIGFFLVEIVSLIVGSADDGAKAGEIMGHVVAWIAFGLLLFIGVKMMIESVRELKKPEEEKTAKKFTVKEVLYFAFATAIDALGSGVALHSGLSNAGTVWIHVGIIMVITFTFSLAGLVFGKNIAKLFKGKYEITGIIGGVILLLLAVWIILSHYLHI